MHAHKPRQDCQLPMTKLRLPAPQCCACDPPAREVMCKDIYIMNNAWHHADCTRNPLGPVELVPSLRSIGPCIHSSYNKTTVQVYPHQQIAPSGICRSGPISPMRTLFLASLSAPESSRALATSPYPILAAFIRAVQPSCTRTEGHTANTLFPSRNMQTQLHTLTHVPYLRCYYPFLTNSF